MDRLITLMSSVVSAGAEDAMRLATALREGRIDLDEVQRWYEQRRDQSMELMSQIGDELGDLRQQGLGRYVSRSASGGSARLARALSGSRRRRRHVGRRAARRHHAKAKR